MSTRQRHSLDWEPLRFSQKDEAQGVSHAAGRWVDMQAQPSAVRVPVFKKMFLVLKQQNLGVPTHFALSPDSTIFSSAV